MRKKSLSERLSRAISKWSIDNDLPLTAGEIERATQAAVRAVHDCGPNARVALSPESAYWQTATGSVMTPDERAAGALPAAVTHE